MNSLKQLESDKAESFTSGISAVYIAKTSKQLCKLHLKLITREKELENKTHATKIVDTLHPLPLIAGSSVLEVCSQQVKILSHPFPITIKYSSQHISFFIPSCTSSTSLYSYIFLSRQSAHCSPHLYRQILFIASIL